MPKDAHARKQIQFLKGELAKKAELIQRTNILVLKQGAVTTLLIEKGIITNEEIQERIKTLLNTDSENSLGMSSESESAGTAEDNSGRGESGILPDTGDRDDSGRHEANGSGSDSTESDQSISPSDSGDGK